MGAVQTTRSGAWRAMPDVQIVPLDEIFGPKYKDEINGRQVRDPDGLHFSLAGQRIAAQAIIDALRKVPVPDHPAPSPPPRKVMTATPESAALTVTVLVGLALVPATASAARGKLTADEQYTARTQAAHLHTLAEGQRGPAAATGHKYHPA